MAQNYDKAFDIPVLPLRGVVVFPKMMLNFDVSRKRSKRALEIAMKGDQLIFLTAQMDPSENEPTFDDIYKVGVVCKIAQILKEGEKSTRVVVEGLYRAVIIHSVEHEACMYASVAPLRSTAVSVSRPPVIWR